MHTCTPIAPAFWTAASPLPLTCLLSAQVSHFVRVYNQAASARGGPGGEGPSSGAAGPSSGDSAEDKAEMELANYLLEVAGKVAAVAPAAGAAGGGGAGAAAPGTGGAAAGSGAEAGGQLGEEEPYRLTLSQYRVRISPGVSTNHRCLVVWLC